MPKMRAHKASVFAAKTKSLSVRPSILWVQIVTLTLPQARKMSGWCWPANRLPKTADGAVEMMRLLKIAYRGEGAHHGDDHPEADRREHVARAARNPATRLVKSTPTASAKHTLRALARRWIALADEITTHDRHLARLTTATSPTLRAGFGVGAGTAAEMLILFGDNPDRIHSEAAFAKLCGACPIPASSGRTTGRHRLSRGGHRQANAALYRCVIVRMRFHHPTVAYVARRTADGRTKREIIRCLKRFLAREIYQRVMTDFRARQTLTQAA